jgi:hypothetical protein
VYSNDRYKWMTSFATEYDVDREAATGRSALRGKKPFVCGYNILTEGFVLLIMRLC